MKVDILGVQIDNITIDEALETVENWVVEKKLTKGKLALDKRYIVTPNPEIVVLAQKDLELKKILNSADLAIPDGIGLKIASAILKERKASNETNETKDKKTIERPLWHLSRLSPLSPQIKERVTGIDLMLKLCEVAEKKGFSVGLLGGKGNTAQMCATVLQGEFPKLRLVVFPENIPIIKEVDILFVAFGAPKQEKWIDKNLSKIPVKVAMGVGGAFEFIARIQKRAPKFVQNLGFEWLWRVVLQPWRIKRQIKLLVFVYLVLKEKLKTKY